MRQLIPTIALFLTALTASAILAGARDDVRIRTDKDDKGNVVYKLNNTGSKNVRVTLRHSKTCSSTTSNRTPTERQYSLTPRRSTHLRKVIANSDCRHTYRIVKAEYY